MKLKVILTEEEIKGIITDRLKSCFAVVNNIEFNAGFKSATVDVEVDSNKMVGWDWVVGYNKEE